jgi:MYXO-CTERM domain-containing protein
MPIAFDMTVHFTAGDQASAAIAATGLLVLALVVAIRRRKL